MQESSLRQPLSQLTSLTRLYLHHFNVTDDTLREVNGPHPFKCLGCLLVFQFKRSSSSVGSSAAALVLLCAPGVFDEATQLGHCYVDPRHHAAVHSCHVPNSMCRMSSVPSLCCTSPPRRVWRPTHTCAQHPCAQHLIALFTCRPAAVRFPHGPHKPGDLPLLLSHTFRCA